MLKPSVSTCSSFLRRVFSLPSRSFLPQSYYNNEVWNSRLSHPSFQNSSARDLGVGILQAINSNRVVSPLDYDVFVNKLHELDVVSTDFIENIVEKYAHTQSAIEVIDSTSHAIVRGYLDFQKYSNLLDLAKRRASTGLFLDAVAANMLADHFADSEDWSSVVETMWELCLQNYFHSDSVSPLTLAFAFLSGVKLIHELPQEQVADSVDDSDEVQYIFVPYVRNPNYDNFFDIDRIRLKLGFLWLHILDLIEHRPHSLNTVPSVHQMISRVRPNLITGLKLFGLSLSEQMDPLKAELSKLKPAEQLEKKQLSTIVLEKLLQITQSARTRDDSQPIERGQPVQPTQSDVTATVVQIQQLIEHSKPMSEDFFTQCDQFARGGILSDEACLNHEIESVRELYSQFARVREQRWSAREEANRRETVLRQARQTLRELVDEEERLNYFKNVGEIHLRAWLAPRTRKERQWSRMKDWRQDIARQHMKQQDSHETEASS